MSRYFSQVHSQTWNNPLVKKMSVEANLLRLYLLSNHFANASGYYIFKPAYAAEDLPISRAKILRALKELEDHGFIRYRAESYALLILDWFSHHGLSSSKNAEHIMTLYKRRLLPQNEPDLEANLYAMLVEATSDRHENEKFGKLFDFLDERTELPPDLADAAMRYRESLAKDEPAIDAKTEFGQGFGHTDFSGKKGFDEDTPFQTQ